MPEIANVWPPPSTGNESNERVVIQRGESTTVMVEVGTAGVNPIPTVKFGASAVRTTNWSETHEVTKTTFNTVSPRKEFAMEFSALPPRDCIPETLSFAILIKFPTKRMPFDLDFRVNCGDLSVNLPVTCDGKTEIRKSAELIPQRT